MTPKLVLVVDDSPTIRKIVELTLRREGYDVAAADSGVTALAAIADRRPDLILLDIMLPNLNGYQICQLLKRNERSKAVPVVMLSGKDGMFDKMKGKLAGAADYVTKPFDSKKLVATVAKYSASRTETAVPAAVAREGTA